MIRIEAVVAQVGGVLPGEVADWVARGWILPSGDPPDWLFGEAEIARVRLVRSLRHQAGIEESDVTIVLSLVDEIRTLRNALNRLAQAAEALPPEARAQLVARLGR